MRSIAITCLLLVAPASLVSAAPGPKETTERISYSGKHSKQSATGDPGWIELASATPASHGREFVMLGADAGTFTRLRITAVSGRPRIHSVRVDYKDGRRKELWVGRVLDAKRRSAVLDLKGAHEIKQIVVVADRKSWGNYVVEGNIADSSVATR